MPNMKGKITLEEIGFTEIESIRMKVLIKTKNYSTASKILHVSPESLRALTFRLRMRKLHVNQFNKQYEEWRKALGPKCDYLNAK